MKEKKDAVIIARVPKELKDKIEKNAKKVDLKPSELIRRILDKFFK